MSVVATIVLLLWVCALGQTVLNLASMPRLEVRPGSSRRRVSVIIPARNEERAIESTVRALLAQTYENLEVIVVDDRSADGTGEILARLAPDEPRLTVLEGEEPPADWLGKPWALHQGSRRATGELLFFIDADVHYQPEAVAAAVALLEERDVAMLALFPRFEMRGFWEHVTMPQLAWSGFVLMPLWLANRTTLTAVAIGGGTGNLVKLDAYRRAGGHESLRRAVVDDIALARQVRSCGERTLIARADDLVSVRMYHGLREIVDGFTKNVFMVVGRSYFAAVLTLLILIVGNLWPYAGAAIAAAHGILGIPLTTTDWLWMGSVALITLVRLSVWGALGYRIDNAILGHPLLTLFWIYQLLYSIWHTGIRGRVEWRGRSYDASSTRFGSHE